MICIYLNQLLEILGRSWRQCTCNRDHPVRPNSNSAEFRASVVLNHSCYVVLGLNWPYDPSPYPISLEVGRRVLIMPTLGLEAKSLKNGITHYWISESRAHNNNKLKIQQVNLACIVVSSIISHDRRWHWLFLWNQQHSQGDGKIFYPIIFLYHWVDYNSWFWMDHRIHVLLIKICLSKLNF